MTDQDQILEAIRTFIAAYNAGDLEGLLTCYSDDLVKVRQGAAPESKAAIAGRLRDLFESHATSVEVENTEISVHGEMAYTRGTFTVTLTPRGGGERQRITRRYLEIWTKGAGGWQVVRAMDNAG